MVVQLGIYACSFNSKGTSSYKYVFICLNKKCETVNIEFLIFCICWPDMFHHFTYSIMSSNRHCILIIIVEPIITFAFYNHIHYFKTHHHSIIIIIVVESIITPSSSRLYCTWRTNLSNPILHS